MKYDRPPLLRYLLLNMKWPLGFVAVTMLFILYWVLIPDDSTANAIKWVLIADGVLLSVIVIGLTIKWRMWS